MGGTFSNKDGFVDMLIETNRPLYTAGQYVDGVVHVNCKDSRNYRTLLIRLTGIEYVYWSEGSGKHRRTYSNRRQTYNHAFDLAIFADGILIGGQYSFPFKFLLPSQMSGSMFESDNCYIRYNLSCELFSSDGKNETQVYSKVLNVLEPPRRDFGMIQKQQICNPQCCGCCFGYGMVKVTMNCDKNIVKGGDQVRVTVVVDNKTGKKDLENIQVHFKEKRWKISSGGAVRNHELHSTTLYVHPKVMAGQLDQFTFNAGIPMGLVYSTSIGSILAKYHVLTLTSSMGCCSNSPFCQFLLFHQSAGQQIEVSPKIPPPQIWMPKLVPEVVYTSMTPFVYSPSSSMPYLNRYNAIGTVNLNNMPTQNGYYNNANTSNYQVY